jgi:hypothetical protein
MANFVAEMYTVRVYIESSMTYIGTRKLYYISSDNHSGTVTDFNMPPKTALSNLTGLTTSTQILFDGVTSSDDALAMFGTNFIQYEGATQLTLRFVFKNNKYIKITPVAYTSSSTRYTMEYYTEGGTLLGTDTYTGSMNRYTGPVRYIYTGQLLTKPTNSDGKCSGIAYQVALNSTRQEYLSDYIQLSNVTNTWKYTFFNGLDPEDGDDPYYDGGISDESNDRGNFYDGSDTISDEGLPTLDAVGTGFATLFTPNKAQLAALADVMWNQNIFAALQNLVENITNMFTGLSIVPFEVTHGATVSVTWLGLFDTGISLTLAAQQFYDIPMGSIDLSDDGRIYVSASALDYAPFSKLGIYLPFIGFQELDIDECRDCVISLHYKVDILSGTCVAMIALNGNEIYQFTGNCLTQIPITNESLEGLVSDAVNVGIAISSVAATQASVSAGESYTNYSGHVPLEKQDQAVADLEKINERGHGQLASATADAAMGMKPNIKKSGAVSAAASLMSIKQPYLFLTTPRQSMPARYRMYCGYPSNITGKLNEFSGFTVVEDIRLNNLVATSSEVAEIYSLLKKGVII